MVAGNTKPDALHALNPRQQRFILEYLLDLSATQAAIRAGYSKHTANEQGARLLAKLSPVVRPLLEAQERHLAEVSGISKERWLQALQHLAFFDVRRLFDSQTGKPLDISTLTLEDATCISGFEVVEEFQGRGANREKIGYTKKVKLCDKLKALELFGKATGFYVERTDVHVKGPLADLSTAILLKMKAELEHRISAPVAKPQPVGVHRQITEVQPADRQHMNTDVIDIVNDNEHTSAK